MNVVLALTRRDFQVQRSYTLPFVFDLAWGVINIFLWYFISRVVGPAPGADLQGAPSYFAFALAGVIAALIIESAATDIAWRIREDQVTGTLEALVSQPLRASQLAAGTAVFPFAYALFRGCLYLLIAVIALDVPTGGIDPLGLLVILLLSGAAFAGIGVIAAAITVVLKRGSSVVGAAVFAMVFLSGAMFPRSVLPGWLEPVGEVMPTRPAFDGLRDALFHDGGWGSEALALVGVAIVLAPLGVAALAWALTIVKRQGSLGQY